MIDFKGKDCLELYDWIAEHGHYLYRLNGEWVCSDFSAVQLLVDSFTPT